MKKITKAVTFSYDDGCVYDKKLIEIFNKYGIKGTFNISGNIGVLSEGWKTDRGLSVTKNDFTKKENVRLYDGHEIAMHTRNHLWLNKIEDDVLMDEILGNKSDLERVFGGEVVGMAYPFNTYDDRAVKILSDNGVLYAREGRETHSFDLQDDLLRFRPTCHHNDKELFNLADEFLAMKTDSLKIFYIWGHSYEFEDEKNWDRIEKLCALLSGRDDIFCGTNRAVFELQKGQYGV